PPHPGPRDGGVWHPFKSQPHYQLVDFIYRHNEMPATHIDELMHIWAANDSNGTPPFANHEEIYKTINMIAEGDAPWECLSIQHVDVDHPADDHTVPPWKRANYEFWCRPIKPLLKHQISNPEFKGHIDYAPRQVFGDRHQCVWSDFMSGNWAWKECNELAKDPDNHGAMFVPIIMGSDKTTVSVATGNNEYYPLYVSNGNIHNSMRRGHGAAVSLVGFLAI
ncbi:hypothetical protein PAXINDRAFT_32952, partial [Paxillus involutus ATCC 200175]